MVSGTFHQIFNLTLQQRLECHTSPAGSRIFKQEADNACSIFGCYTIKLELLLLAIFFIYLVFFVWRMTANLMKLLAACSEVPTGADTGPDQKSCGCLCIVCKQSDL